MSSSELAFRPLAAAGQPGSGGFRDLRPGATGGGFRLLDERRGGEGPASPALPHEPTPEELRERTRRELQEEFDARLAEQESRHGEALHQLAATLREEREERLSTLARASVALAFQVARRIIARELAHDDELPVRVLAEGLGELGLEGELVVHAHPGLAELLGRQPGALEALGVAAVHPDPALAEGGLRVAQDGQEFDTGLPERLAQLEDAVVAALGEG